MVLSRWWEGREGIRKLRDTGGWRRMDDVEHERGRLEHGEVSGEGICNCIAVVSDW